MEKCKNCKYAKEVGSYDSTYYVCAIINRYINFPRFMGGSRKCACYKRAEKKKDKFIYPTLDKLEDYLQTVGENQGDPS